MKASGVLHFNSIKVRLELRLQDTWKRCSSFQFHKGTIRTDDTWNERNGDLPFQFHKGTIRTSTSI